MFKYNNYTIEQIKYFEMYHDNENDCNILYLECLTKHNEDLDHLQRAIIRIPEFKVDIEISDMPDVRIKNANPENSFEHSLASRIPGYKYKSLKEEYSNLMNVQYNETLLYTGSDESFPLKYTIEVDDME